MSIRIFATPKAGQYAMPSGVVVIPPPPAPSSRAYSTTAGVAIDISGYMLGDTSGDIGALLNQGFGVLGPTPGATAARPVNPPPGTIYYDTTLSLAVFWDGASWRNINTFATA